MRFPRNICSKRNITLIVITSIILLLFFMFCIHGQADCPSIAIPPETKIISPVQLPSNLSAFTEKMTYNQKTVLLEILTTFVWTMTASSLTYHLYGGSLLGVYRHGGIIPWDDDIDVWINKSEAEILKRTFPENKGFHLHTEDNTSWKLYSDKGLDIFGVPFKWPYIDIFQFYENNTHVWDASKQYRESFVYKKSDVYPLKLCQFDNFMVNVPKKLEKIVKFNYDPSVCVTNKFDHKTNTYVNTQRQAVPCYHLHKYYTFDKPDCASE